MIQKFYVYLKKPLGFFGGTIIEIFAHKAISLPESVQFVYDGNNTLVGEFYKSEIKGWKRQTGTLFP